MVMVRSLFSPHDSGIYALAQMLGKIFLFLPVAISVVMFPRAAKLKASNEDTSVVLRLSALYALALCFGAALTYNLFPALFLKILTGKALPESIALGRLFSVSMSFFTLSFVFMTYFLSLKDFRFIKYMVAGCIAQFICIGIWHDSLFQVQLIICVVAFMLLGVNVILALRKTG
jgi:O-antigen/teichoic acid export membrane protein